jgi:hypothetical protein
MISTAKSPFCVFNEYYLTKNISNTGKPRYMCFRSMRVSVNMATNIYTIPLYAPSKISNSAADYETKDFKQCKKKSCPKTVARKQCCQIVLLPRHYAAISSVSLRPPAKADVSEQCLPTTVFHPK